MPVDPSIPAVQEQPAFFKSPHDISGQRQGPWRFLLDLGPDVTLANASISLVDANGNPIAFDATGLAGDSLLLTFDRFQLAGPPLGPTVWAVYFFTRYGNASPFADEPFWRIQCRYTDSTGSGSDLVMLLLPKK